MWTQACATVEDWRDRVARLASGHVLPVLAISAALAGPLLHLAEIEGGGLHVFGQSSKGKTTLLRLAASVWGRGDGSGYVRTWRASANGLEGTAAGATDTGLILDEVGQVEARDMAAALYALANGTGKARAARDGGLREPKTWRVLVISSGEVPVDGKLSEDRSRKTRAGQLVRLLDIPAQRVHGVFDHPGPNGDPASLAKAFRLAAISAYGTAGPEFVRRLIGERVTGEAEPDAAEIEERAALAADRVPAVYLDAWASLQCTRPLSIDLDAWRRAINDAGLFLDAWGADAAAMAWSANELFDVPRAGRPGGLLWRLSGGRVQTLGKESARLTDGRMIRRLKFDGDHRPRSPDQLTRTMPWTAAMRK
jgi:hypothetical protein